MRSLTKRLLYLTGLLSWYHRLRNRNQLTVVLFHRVLPDAHPEWPQADPTCTVSETVFRGCLQFFARHYTVVGLGDLLAAREERRPLPSRPLLITFDDGWADNEEVALRLLRQAAFPAVVFMVAGAVGERGLYGDRLRHAWRRGALDEPACDRLWGAIARPPAPVPARWNEEKALCLLIDRLASVDEPTRAALLEAAPGADNSGRQPAMLSAEQLRALRAAGVDIGSHGWTHMPLSVAPDPVVELRRSKAALEEILGHQAGPGRFALSFPYGLYTPHLVSIAQQLGYSLLFTSDQHLNSLSNRTLQARVLGRISICAADIINSSGRLRPELLAMVLFGRPRR